jgi:sulfite exporter TauE/SafE
VIHAVGGAHQKLQPDGLKNILHGRVLSWLILGWAIGRVGASESTTFAASIFCFLYSSFGVSIGCILRVMGMHSPAEDPMAEAPSAEQLLVAQAKVRMAEMVLQERQQVRRSSSATTRRVHARSWDPANV